MVVVIMAMVVMVMIVTMHVYGHDHDRGHDHGRARDHGRELMAMRSSSSSPATGLSSSSTVHLLVRRLGQLQDMVDHLVLEDRRPQLHRARPGSSRSTRRPCAPGPDSGAPARSGRAELVLVDLDAVSSRRSRRSPAPAAHAARRSCGIPPAAPPPACPRRQRLAPRAFRFCASWLQMPSNSPSTSVSGNAKSCALSSASRTCRLSFMRATDGVLAWRSWPRTISRSLGQRLRAQRLGELVVDLRLIGLATSLTLTVNTASLPASFFSPDTRRGT